MGWDGLSLNLIGEVLERDGLFQNPNTLLYTQTNRENLEGCAAVIKCLICPGFSFGPPGSSFLGE